MKKFIWVLIIIFVLGTGFLFIMKKKQKFARAQIFSLRETPVSTVEAQKKSLYVSHNYMAFAEAEKKAVISSKVTSEILKIHVDTGDNVQEGQTLVELDNRQIVAQYNAIESQIEQTQAELAANQASTASLEKTLEYAKTELARYTTLLENSSVSQSQYDSIKEKYNETNGKYLTSQQKNASISAQIAALNAKKNEISVINNYYMLKSPFSGKVTIRNTDPGNIAAPGKELLVIENSDTLKVVFDIPQSDISFIKTGLPVILKTDHSEFKTTLNTLYPTFDSSKMLMAEVTGNDPFMHSLIPGQYLNVEVIIKSYNDSVVLPVSALFNDTETSADIFIVENSVLTLKKIKILGTVCEYSAVEGIAAGEKVVFSPFLGWAQLYDGMKVAEK